MGEMECQFKIYRLSDEFSEVNFCDDESCKKCQSIKEELNTYIQGSRTKLNKLHSSERTFIIGISPTPDYLSYWKSSEGLNQIIDGLFRGRTRELNRVKVLLSFDFTPVKGFSIPLISFVCQTYGDSESLNLINDELMEWSPRICGWLSDVTESGYKKNCSDYNQWDFDEFLTTSELTYLGGLTQLPPVELDWSEFMNLRGTGILKRIN